MKIPELAKKYGRSAEWVRKLVNTGFIPKPVDREIDFEAAAIGIFHWQEKRLEVAEGARAELSRSRAGVADIHKQREELKLKKELGNLVELKLVELVWTAQVIAARQVVMQSSLSRTEQDALLSELENAPVEIYLDQAKKIKP